MIHITKIKLNNMRVNPNIALSATHPCLCGADVHRKATIMTSFVHLNYSRKHPGVSRVESAIGSAQNMRRTFSGKRALATLFLSAMVAAGMVVAYQVMDTVAEGHLLVMWIAMWAVAFATLALFAGTARNLAARLKAGLDGWSSSLAQSRADERLWAIATKDARVMSDLQAAMTRAEDDSIASPAAAGMSARATRLSRSFWSGSF